MVFQMKWKSNQDMAPTFPYNFENVILCNYIGTYSQSLKNPYKNQFFVLPKNITYQ